MRGTGLSGLLWLGLTGAMAVLAGASVDGGAWGSPVAQGRVQPPASHGSTKPTVSDFDAIALAAVRTDAAEPSAPEPSAAEPSGGEPSVPESSGGEPSVPEYAGLGRDDVEADGGEADLRPVFGLAIDGHPPAGRQLRRPGHQRGEQPASQLHAVEGLPAPGEVLFQGDSDQAKVAITFDDGPSTRLTPKILEILAAHHAVATFFVLGERVQTAPELVRQIVEAGHEVGNHSFSHPSFRSLFPSQVAEELERTDSAIESAAGVRPRFVRPPFGRFAPSNVEFIARRGGDVILWSVDAADWSEASCGEVAEAVVSAAKPGSIILLHDREPTSACALGQILTGLSRRGLATATVSELVERPAYL